MHDSAARRLSDLELRSANLVISDPLAVEGVSANSPDARFRPVVVAEYHLPPGAASVPCSYCEQHQAHRHGLVAEFAPGSRHLIGSSCGPDKLDLHFGAARRNHRELVDRQDYLARLDTIALRGPKLLGAADMALFSDRLAELDAVAAEFARSAGDALARLRSLQNRGGPLTEIVQVRDLEAERNRDDKLPDGQTGGPIYVDRPAPLGQLRGHALLTSERLRREIHAFKLALKNAVGLLVRDTDDLPTGALKKTVLALERAWEAANAAMQSVNDARQFFITDHLASVVRWAASYSADRLETDGVRLFAISNEGRRTSIGPLSTNPVDALPPLGGD